MFSLSKKKFKKDLTTKLNKMYLLINKHDIK